MGYAGGTEIGKDGNVCYKGPEDYGKMGHAEVVNMVIPKEKYYDFAKIYFGLFVDGHRPDTGDVGAEYRHLVGIPGGVNSELFSELERANNGLLSLPKG